MRKAEEFKIGQVLKFVRVNGQYRFTTIHVDHCDLVGKDEKAESAGVLSLMDDGMFFMSKRSMTLGIGVLPVDYQELPAMFASQYGGKAPKIEDWKGF